MEETVWRSDICRWRIVFLGTAAALAIGLGGCGTSLTQSATHPDRPEIASGRLVANRVRSGCPVRLRLTIRDAEANVARALASWSYEGATGLGGKPVRVVQDGFAAVPLDPGSLAGRPQGEVEIVLTPLQPGHYVYAVQVEDAAGHRSNVLEQSFTVLAQPVGKPVSCADPVE
jgi:hypothetical protein